MPLDDAFPEAVVFIIGQRRQDDGTNGPVPIGTGFMVSIASTTVAGGYHLYVVTAAHVVEGEEMTSVRFNRTSGGVVDFDVPGGWYTHPSEDVAAVPMGLSDEAKGLGLGVRLTYMAEADFLDKSDMEPHLGDPVYFVGLLANITAMAAANVPMVRSGTLGRLYQEQVPIRRPDASIRHITAHLIDCRAYAGFSGSPCFVQSTVRRIVGDPAFPTATLPTGIGILHAQEVRLLGLISGHFDQWEQARTTGDILGTIHTPVNSGVGVVVPVEAIRHLLEEDEGLVARRKDIDEKAKTAKPSAGATLDKIPPLEETQFRREDFLADLAKVNRPPSPDEKPDPKQP